MRSRGARILSSIGFILLFVLLTNARRSSAELFGSVPIAAAIIMPVLAGMLIDWKHAGVVGFLGASLAAMSPAGSYLLLFTIVPMAATGIIAGLIHRRSSNSFISSLSVLLGYFFITVVLVTTGFIPLEAVLNAEFWHIFMLNSIAGAIIALVVYKLFKLLEAPVVSVEKRPRRTISLEVGVWKILGVIFLLLTGLFIVFFSFPLISLTLVTGGALLMLADKLRADFMRWAQDKNISGMQRRIYGHILWLFWALITIAIISVAISNVTGAITDLGRTEPADYITPVEGYLPDFVTDNILTEKNVRLAESTIFDGMAQILSNSTTFMLIAIILIPLMFITYFRQRDEIAENFSQFIPETIRPSIMEMVSRVSKHLKAFVSAKIIESLIVGMICVTGFYIAGIEGFFVLGILAGLLNIIPYVGPILGAIPALLLALTQAPVASLIVLITVVFAQLVDNLYLQPFMISQQVQINPLITVLITFIGAQALGIIGMVFAIPVYLIYKLILGETHRILVTYTK